MTDPAENQEKEGSEAKIRRPSLAAALFPVLLLMAMLSANVFLFEDTLDGANQMALLLAAAAAALVAVYHRISWNEISSGIVATIGSAMPAILILLFIGSLAGTWLLSGIIPAMIYYGLDLIQPGIFLFATVLICALVSLATGSSWSTVATIGVALLGMGTVLGLEKGLVAGAILSGAYFGDKMSPLSDTTNLAPAMAGTDLFTHIRYMAQTTMPTIVITMIIFFIIGLTRSFADVATEMAGVQEAIMEKFLVHPVLFLVPVLMIILIIRRVPPLAALLFGSLAAGLMAVVFQPELVREMAGIEGGTLKVSYVGVMKAMFSGITVPTDNPALADLLDSGGMAGMLPTVWLIISAMVFGGVMEAGGLLSKITSSIMRLARSTGSLVATTAGTCLFLNVSASDQYISIVLPGRMFKEAYQNQGLKPEVLSRALEGSGTVTSVLVPWNTCGATQSRVLGVPTLAYLPYTFFCLMSPFMEILYAYLNIKIRRIPVEERERRAS